MSGQVVDRRQRPSTRRARRHRRASVRGGAVLRRVRRPRRDPLDGAARTPAPGHDVVVFYDMPGLRFTRRRPAGRADPRRPPSSGRPSPTLSPPAPGWCSSTTPSPAGRRGRSTPSSSAAASTTSRRRLDGVDYPDSGYRFDVTHTVEVLDPRPPGVRRPRRRRSRSPTSCTASRSSTDDVVPLMRTTFDTTDASQFFSADLAHPRPPRTPTTAGRHPPGQRSRRRGPSSAGASPVVYLQFGDGPETYADPSFRTRARATPSAGSPPPRPATGPQPAARPRA